MAIPAFLVTPCQKMGSKSLFPKQGKGGLFVQENLSILSDSGSKSKDLFPTSNYGCPHDIRLYILLNDLCPELKDFWFDLKIKFLP